MKNSGKVGVIFLRFNGSSNFEILKIYTAYYVVIMLNCWIDE